MKDCIKILKEDFKEAVSQIDFKGPYNPWGKAFMKASFLGEMWFLMKSLYEDDEVESEIEGARTYFERFLTTGDTTFRDMAKDELRHAGILIKKDSEWADEDKKKILDAHESERQELMKAIDKTIKE